MTALYFADIYLCCCEVAPKTFADLSLGLANDKFAVIIK